MEKVSSTTTTSRNSRLLAFRSSTAFITFVIAYAVFTEQFLFAVVVPVAPFSLQQRVHIPEDRILYWISWLLAIYGIAAFLSSPVWGWWTDRNPSRRVPFLIGLVWLLAATILLWFANSRALLVLSRTLQGIATTVIWTTGLAVLVDTVGEARIGEYMGYVGVALNLGTLIAPMLGGVVFAKAGYNAVFGMACAVIAVDIVLRFVMVERRTGDGHSPPCILVVDVETGFPQRAETKTSHTKAMSISSTTSDIWATSEVDLLRADAAIPRSPLAVRLSWRDRLPPVITLCFSPRFVVALWGIFVQATLYTGFQAVLPLHLHDIFGWDSIGGGAIFLPLVIPGLLGPLIGKLSDRFGPRWFATAGFIGLCPVLILLRLVRYDNLAQKAALCVLLVFVGFFSSCTLEPLVAEITYLGGEKCSYAQAYALFNGAWSLGNTVGALLAGLLLERAGWGTMSLTMGLLAGVTAIPTALWCGGWVFGRRRYCT